MSFKTDEWQQPADDVHRPLPFALGPEKSILSSMLQDPQEYIPAALDEGITTEHFYLPSHATLFEHLAAEFADGEEIELVSMIQKLLDTGRLDRVGGPSTLTDLYTYAPGGSHFRHHLENVRDKFVLRQLIQMGNSIIAAACDSPGESQETLAEADRMLTAISAGASVGTPIPANREVLKICFDRFERRTKGAETTMGIPLLPLLDRHLYGGHPNRMIVIGAYPEGGKSVMASQMLLSAAEDGHPGIYLSLEMSEEDIMDRMIVQVGRIHAKAFTDPAEYARENGGPEVTKGLMQAIVNAARKLKDMPIRVKRVDRKLSSIIATIRRAHREYGIKVAVVDYAQRIKGTKTESRELEQTECSNALQTLAGDLGITIIVPSQLNEDGETKHGKVWQEDADAVILIVQDRNKESPTYKQHRHTLIAKDRHYGSGGTRVPLILDREYIRFVEGQDETASKKPQFQR
jgi:replicative DNA helicase